MRWLPLAVSLLLAVPASARMDALDPTFGTAGIAAVPLRQYVAHCYAVARQPDGALVLAGGSDVEINSDSE